MPRTPAAVLPIGLTGSDEQGNKIRSALKKRGIPTSCILRDTRRYTTTKTRILAGELHSSKQQVIRVDRGDRRPISRVLEKKVLEKFRAAVSRVDAILVSDYGYGVLTPRVIAAINNVAQKGKIPVTVDSRYNLLKYQMMTVATPNEPEIKRIFPAKSFYDDGDFYQAGLELLERLKAQGIVLKRGHKGMIVFEKNKEPMRINIHGSSNIVDVTGAGDTVISVVGLSLCAGADLVSSAQLANIAAGLVVMKEGCYPISKQELEHELR